MKTSYLIFIAMIFGCQPNIDQHYKDIFYCKVCEEGKEVFFQTDNIYKIKNNEMVCAGISSRVTIYDNAFHNIGYEFYHTDTAMHLQIGGVIADTLGFQRYTGNMEILGYDYPQRFWEKDPKFDIFGEYIHSDSNYLLKEHFFKSLIKGISICSNTPNP